MPSWSKITPITLLLVGLIVILSGITYFQVSSLSDQVDKAQQSAAIATRNFKSLQRSAADICATEDIKDNTKCQLDIQPDPVDVYDGIDGQDGADGIQGPMGLAGPQGPRGFPGEDGRDGANGLTGADGLNGLDGSVGATGADGPVGPIGPQGPIGPVGPIGPQGPAGPAGADGANGVDGADGWTCPSGADPTPFSFFAYASPSITDQDRVQYTGYTC